MPQSAPRSSPRLGGSNPRLGPYFRILTFSTAVFCYIQLASSSAVPGVPWDSHGELIVCIFSCQNQLFVHKSQISYYTLPGALEAVSVEPTEETLPRIIAQPLPVGQLQHHQPRTGPGDCGMDTTKTAFWYAFPFQGIRTEFKMDRGLNQDLTKAFS